MCGIVGIFAYHSAANKVCRSELTAIRDHMTNRGPDGAGLWCHPSERIGLGHRRLAIIDLSDGASQPMKSEDGNAIIVFNGEIFNFRELRSKLIANGYQFRTQSDTEVLLQLYAERGTNMVEDLRGMFAFAIWDERRHGLFLARDPYGIKPLYTADDGWTFRFASQVKALLGGKKVSRDPEPAGIVGFHLFGSVPEPFTVYRGIRALPAGHFQWIDSSGAHEPKPYETISAILSRAAGRPTPAVELNDRVREGVLDSVRAHLIADVEVGIFLSAGVDSGALLGLMRDAGQRDIRAITLAFDEFRDTSEDEALYAGRVAKLYNARHIVRRISEKEFHDDLPAIFEAMDQPSIDGVNTWFVAKAAKEAGLKVAISGLGGDELLAGYPSFIDIPRWRRRFGPFARLPGLGRLLPIIARAFAPRLARARPKALGMFEYAGSWAGAYLLRRGLFLPDELPLLIDPDVAREGLARLDPIRRLGSCLAPDPGNDVARVCALESSHYLRNQLLRDADWAGMAHSIEIRVPLVDSELLKRIAPAFGTLVPGEGKAALACSPTLPLPKETAARAKTGFGVPIGAWMSKTLAQRPPSSRAGEPKGVVSRNWSLVVLPRVMSANENSKCEALAS